MASMRPRHKAAEYFFGKPVQATPIAASMRPRHKAAEYTADWPHCSQTPPRFNEAAA